jgi:hypothetical protein
MRCVVREFSKCHGHGWRSQSPPVRHAQWLVELDRRLRRRIGWAQQRPADLHVLREAYRAGDLSLVLGVGVSMAAKMPGWKDLVVGILDLALSYRQRLIERAQRSSVVSLKGKIYLRDDSQDPERFVDERIPPLTSDLRSLLEKTREALKRSENYDDQLLLEATEELSGEQLEQLSEKYRAMGLLVIWIKSHDDIPISNPRCSTRRTSQWLVRYRRRPRSILHLAPVCIACR